MTIKEKILAGRLTRPVVEANLKTFRSMLEVAKLEATNKTGLKLDLYNSSTILSLNTDIALGERILAVMQEMGV